MRNLLPSLFLLSVYSAAVFANVAEARYYLNPHVGFDVEGFNYQQKQFPCRADSVLIERFEKRAGEYGIVFDTLHKPAKPLHNYQPLIAIDVTELVLTDDVAYGKNPQHPLPKMAINLAIVNGDDRVISKQSCAISSLSEFTSSSDILDMGTVTTVCGALERCIGRLAKDSLQWIKESEK